MLIRYLGLGAVLAAALGILLYAVPPAPEEVEAQAIPGYQPNFVLPADYQDTLVHYATIDRPDGRSRDIFVSPGAPEAIANNSTLRLPNGTMIVIDAHLGTRDRRRGSADNVHVAVKRDDWQSSDYQSAERAGDWNYFSFDPQTGELTDEDMFSCFNCHANNAQIDFIFSRDELSDYGETGEVQQGFCNRPDRLPCR